MLTSRKIVNVKTLLDENENVTYVKAVIKKSYGSLQRPAVVMFQDGVPVKAHCHCPVGLSGVCCHVLALLLFLKHYHETGEQILMLTCTQQLQKWHRRQHNSSIPMMPLRKFKAKSAIKKTMKGIEAADPDNSRCKRNVEEIINKMKENIKKFEMSFKPFEHHVCSVLSNSKIGPTSLSEHLRYRYSLKASRALIDHDYCKESFALSTTSDSCQSKMQDITNNIQRALNSKCATSTENKNQSVERDLKQPLAVTSKETVMYENTVKATDIINSIEVQLQDQAPVININISNQKGPSPGGKNYYDVTQNTENWLDIRKHKITGSRLPALLGLYGNNKFTSYWKVVKEGLNESDVMDTSFNNFKRGHQYEKEAISVFCQMSNSKTESCGFFEDPNDSNYGASPDALASPPFILEIKTRAGKASGPLLNLAKQPSYYIQPQLQMECTGALYCILESYHPETQSASYFLIKKDEVLMSVIKDITNSILKDKVIVNWFHTENKHYRILGKNVQGHIPDFASIRPLRSHINDQAKSIPRVKFERGVRTSQTVNQPITSQFQ